MSVYACLDELEHWLNDYLNFEKTPQKNIFWLDTMQFLCRTFSHPERHAPCFHVAGSKGKGSVSAFISAILEEAGNKTGLYTSPHILDFVERIGGAHAPFAESVYQAASDEMRATIDALPQDALPAGRRLTWFELVTLYAFLCFKHANVSYSVFEVGLGGRLDSTNVIQPVACCITPIEREHTEFLGNTVEEIAAEKGGIIKAGVPVFSAAQEPSVQRVFERIATEKKAPLTVMSPQLVQIQNCYQKQDEAHACRMEVTLTSSLFSRPLTAGLQLFGNFQAQNAALAAVTVKSVLPTIDEKAIERGLAHARLPGRFEWYEPHTLLRAGFAGIQALVLDGAHTVNSVRFTLETFADVFKNHASSPAHLLFACAADKDMRDIALLFAENKRFSHITLTRPGAVKQSNLPLLESAFKDAGLFFTCTDDYEKAISLALKKAHDEHALLLATGSFYLLAEIKKYLQRQIPAAPAL